MAVKDGIPSLPPVPGKVDPTLRPLLQALRDALMVRAHQTKNYWDHSPTMKELFDAGIIDVHGNPNGSGLRISVPVDDTSGGNDPIDETSTPDAPTGLVVAATPWAMLLSWDSLNGNMAHLVAYTEIWWNPVDDRNTATLVGTTPGFAFMHPVEPDSTQYYWVRFVSHFGVEGWWNAIEGTIGIALPDPGKLLDILTGAITESQLYATLQERIDLIDTPVTGLVDGLAAEVIARQADTDSLQASIDSVAGAISAQVLLNRFEVDDIGDWEVPAGNTLTANSTDFAFEEQSGLVTFSHANPAPYTPDMYTEVLRLPIPMPQGISFSGVQLRVRIYAKRPPTYPAVDFAIGYAIDNAGQTHSGWRTFTPTHSWAKYEFTYNAPAGVTESDQAYFVIWADTSNSGLGMLFDNAMVDIDGSVQDLSGIQTNAQAIQVLQNRVTVTEDEIVAQGVDLSSLTAAVSDPVTGNVALGTAYTGLETRVTSAEGSITSQSSDITALQSAVADPATGLTANAAAIDLVETDIVAIDDTLTSHGSRITSLENDITDPSTGLTATADAISGLDTRVTYAEGLISAHATDITDLEAAVNDPTSGLGANASAITQLSTDVGAIADDVTAVSAQYTTLATTVGENTTAVQVVATSIDGLEGQYTVKIDANGYVAGFGLSNTTDIYNPLLGHSQFYVAVDTFAIYNPANLANDVVTFTVDTINGRVVMDGAFIKNATIGTAAIKDAAIITAHIGEAQIVEGHIVDGEITNAKIGNYIQSTNWVQATHQGWKIDKNGHIEASSIRLYNAAGQLILDAGGGTYESRIDNYAQQYSDIQNSPNSLAELNPTEGAKLAGIANGATKNAMTRSPNDPSGGSFGDMWWNYNTNVLWQYLSSGWTKVSVNAWGDILDPTGTKPVNGATKNLVTYSSAAPTGGTDGDIWYRTTTGQLYHKQAGTWRLTANDTQLHFQNNPITPANMGTYIAAAAIDTLYLANNVIIVPVFSQGGGATVTGGQNTHLTSGVLTIPNVGQGSSKVALQWFVNQAGQNSNASNLKMELYRWIGWTPTLLWTRQSTNRDDWASGVYLDTSPPLGIEFGYSLAMNRTGYSGSVQVYSSALLIQAVKR